MIDVDQYAKSITLNFNCPRCGKHIGYCISDFPQPNIEGNNYTDSVHTEYVQIECFSCRKETFDVLLSAGNGDKNLIISNPKSPYPINEEDVQVIVNSYI